VKKEECEDDECDVVCGAHRSDGEKGCHL
jgi:hypothetical protein